MDIKRLLRYSQMGKEHWWLLGKYSILNDLFYKYFSVPKTKALVLDIGSAGGEFLSRVRIDSRKIAVDINCDILKYIKQENCGIEVFRANAKKLPFRDNSFDALFLIDVIEHVKEDLMVLEEAYRVLKPGGILEISVPAFNCLFGRHDVLYGHLRRYNKKQLEIKLKQSGYVIVKTSYIQPLFFLPLYFKNKVLHQTQEDNFVRLPGPLNYLLTKLISYESIFLRFMNFPFGATLVNISKKLN
jgi:SAM-dependent methyltransferase